MDSSEQFNFRLVPDQDPHEIERLFLAYIRSITPGTVTCEVRPQLFAKPVTIPLRHWAIRAAAPAYAKGFGAPPAYLRSGGTIPAVNSFEELLDIPTILMGFGLPDDHSHGPNERLHLPTFGNGIATAIFFLRQLREVGAPARRVGWDSYARSSTGG